MPEGVKWRGKSVYQVLVRLDEAARTESALRMMELAAKARVNVLEREAKEKLIEIADELTGLEPDDLHLGRYWDCKDSPTDHCIYNNTLDSWHDDCLFCGEPADRG